MEGSYVLPVKLAHSIHQRTQSDYTPITSILSYLTRIKSLTANKHFPDIVPILTAYGQVNLRAVINSNKKLLGLRQQHLLLGR